MAEWVLSSVGQCRQRRLGDHRSYFKSPGAGHDVDSSYAVAPSNRYFVCVLLPSMDELVIPARVTKVTIHSWNINGDFVAKMICPNFNVYLHATTLTSFRRHISALINISQFRCHIMIRFYRAPDPQSQTFDDPWGGVAIVISHRIQYQVRDEFSGPDFLVIQVGNCLLYCTYLLPESADWSTSTLTDDPCDCLAASLARARQAGFNVIILGDLNARTGSRRVSPIHPLRISLDKKISTRGRWLLQLLKDTDVVLLNGIVPLSLLRRAQHLFRAHAALSLIMRHAHGTFMTIFYPWK